MNTRTSEARYYKITGAEEYSAMEAAEGEVQHLGYDASFPSLININGLPTYIMVLKDNGGLVKLFALVNVEQYNIVATGSTQKEAIAAYKKLMSSYGISGTGGAEEVYSNRQITVKDIKFIVQGDETIVYITDTNGNVYKQNFSENENLILIQPEDSIKVYFDESDDKINILYKYE